MRQRPCVARGKTLLSAATMMEAAMTDAASHFWIATL
jgi:hypothetical protein